MATKRQTATERVDELEQLLVDIWNEAQNCDGSRGEQQTALDNIQGLIENEIPDVEDLDPSEGETDDEETEEE